MGRSVLKARRLVSRSLRPPFGLTPGWSTSHSRRLRAMHPCRLASPALPTSACHSVTQGSGEGVSWKWIDSESSAVYPCAASRNPVLLGLNAEPVALTDCAGRFGRPPAKRNCVTIQKTELGRGSRLGFRRITVNALVLYTITFRATVFRSFSNHIRVIPLTIPKIAISASPAKG